MTLDEYQQRATGTADFSESMPAWVYLSLGLVSESGEVADKLKKVIRNQDSQFTAENYQDLKKELGDVLWYVSQLARELGFSLDEVGQTNLAKLADRKARNVIKSTGDNR